jgi:hypothetical protein
VEAAWRHGYRGVEAAWRHGYRGVEAAWRHGYRGVEAAWRLVSVTLETLIQRNFQVHRLILLILLVYFLRVLPSRPAASNAVYQG